MPSLCRFAQESPAARPCFVSGFHQPCGTRSVPLTAGADLNLRIFFDSSSVEVFVNDGEACLSSRIYPQAPRRELALFAWSGSAALNEAGAWQLE